MITAMLSGNLGNHMFNYAIVRSVAKRTGYQYAFDPVPKYDYLNGKEQMDFLDVDYGPFPSNVPNKYHEKRVIYNHNGDKVNVQVYDPDVFKVSDNTELVGGCWQSEQYYSKEDLKEWFKIRPEYEQLYKNDIAAAGIALDENLCTINFRGGEYLGIPQLILKQKYYADAIAYMRSINRDIRFVIITDDIRAASMTIPNIPCFHISIGCDYYILNKTQWSILANSSFSIIPTLNNDNLRKVVAPKYWARHNTSNGYWAIGDQYYKGWEYINRDGKVEDYSEVKRQAIEWRLLNGL